MKITSALLFVGIICLCPSAALAVHDDRGDTQCLDCHQTLPFDREKLAYTDDVGTTCRKCHAEFPCGTQSNKEGFSHPLEVQPTMTIPRDMPLTASGKITCITCHSYHAEFWDAEYNTESLLRRSKGEKLCHTCHKKLPVP
jgi:hypothetical protein